MRKKFIIYLTTDGAGTHILRSLMMELNSRNLVERIDHSEFWPKAAAALYKPDGFIFSKMDEGQDTNFSVFQDLCAKHSVYIEPHTLNEEKVFAAFEKIYCRDKEKPLFDFSRKYTSEADGWTQDYIDVLQKLVMDYYHQSTPRIDLKFIIQVRNPLDHIASLQERFNNLEKQRDLVISNLSNIQKLKPLLKDEDFIYLRLEDIIHSFPALHAQFKQKIGIEITTDFYLSKISLNKWLSCPRVHRYLYDQKLTTLAEQFSYSFKVQPKSLMFVEWIKGVVRREVEELKLVEDMASGKVNVYNSISTKHANSGILARFYRCFLFLFQHEKLERIDECSRRYNSLLSKHNL